MGIFKKSENNNGNEIKFTDDDKARYGEVIENRGIYSKAMRKAWVAKKWLNFFANYISVVMILITAFILFSYYFYYSKTSPIVMIQYSDGVITCSRPFIIEDGERKFKFTDKQIETCLSLKKYKK